MTEEAKLAPEQPPEGYDVLEPSDEAVLHCGWIIHEAVKALNDALGEHTVGWEANKASVTAGIRRMLGNPKETPEENHNAWMEYKAKEGWKLGRVKDETLKTHPCMVPYDMLPPIQQSKDMLFRGIVAAYFGLPIDEEVDVTEGHAQRLREYAAEKFTIEYASNGESADPTPEVYELQAPDADRDWRPTLEANMMKRLNDLAVLGATKLRVYEDFQYVDDPAGLELKASFTALDAEGKEVSLAHG